MVQATDVHDFDLYGPAVIADPYPTYRAMREVGPVVRVGGVPFVTTFELADQILKDPLYGRGVYNEMMRKALGDGPLFQSINRWMLYMDPPDHTRLRRLVMRAFTPRAVERLRDKIQELVDDLLDDMDGSGEVDFLASFAYPLPVQVICELLNVPVEDQDDFRTWSADLGRGLVISAASEETTARGNAAADGLNQYFRELIAARRAHPQDGFLDDLIAAEHEGGRLSDDELMSTVVLLFFAGHETTVNLLGNGLAAMLQSRDQWAALCAEPDLAHSAVEEMLRFDTPVQRANRVALTDVVLDGEAISAGEMVMILIAGANRDPLRFSDPETFDLRRADGPHLSFSSGPHYCSGATLARVEAEIAMSSLARRFPNLELSNEPLRSRPNVVLRGYETVPVSLRG